MFRFLFSCYSHCFDILLACNISSMSHFASLPEHCQCYPREDVFPIFSLGSVREIHSLGKYFSVHSLGHSEYQEIHTLSALNIDSVKINTSLLMMRECPFPFWPKDATGARLLYICCIPLALPSVNIWDCGKHTCLQFSPVHCRFPLSAFISHSPGWHYSRALSG